MCASANDSVVARVYVPLAHWFLYILHRKATYFFFESPNSFADLDSPFNNFVYTAPH